MILLRNYSCVRMRIEEGADTDDHKEYRESVRLEIRQGNGIVKRSVEGLHDGTVKVSTLDRIDAIEALVYLSHRYQPGKLTAKLHVRNKNWLVRSPYRDTERN
jgi:hypothetical protein